MTLAKRPETRETGDVAESRVNSARSAVPPMPTSLNEVPRRDSSHPGTPGPDAPSDLAFQAANRQHQKASHRSLDLIRRVGRWVFMNVLSVHSGALVIVLALARIVSPVSLGEFAVGIVELIAIRSLAGLGVGDAVVEWSGDPSDVAPTAMTISLVVGVMVGTVSYVAAPLLAGAIGAPEAAHMTRLLAVAAVICGVAVVPRAMVQRRAPSSRIIVDETGNWLGVVVTVGLAAAGFGLPSLAVGAIAGCLVSTGLFVVMTPKAVRVGFSFQRAAEMLHPASSSGLAEAVVCAVAITDLIVVGVVLHARMLGLYVLALCCASWPISTLSRPVHDMAVASLARFRESPKLSGSIFRSSARLLASVVVPTGILIASSAGPLVHGLYGPAWALAAGPLLWLAPLAVLRVFYEVADEYIATFISRRRRQVLRLIWLTGLIPALVTGARLGGIVGVAMWEIFGTAVLVGAWFVMGLSPGTARSGSRASLLRVCLAAVAGVTAFGVLRAIDHDYTTLVGAGALTLLIVGFSLYRRRTFLHAVRRVTRPSAELVGDPLRSAGILVIEPPTRTALSVVPPAPTSRTLPPAAENLGSRVRKGARWSMLNAILMRVSSSVVTAYLARTVFGPRIWGLYAVSQVVLVLLLSANELGICSAIIRWDGDVRNVARTVLTISVATSTIVYAALFAAAPEIARTLGSPGATSVVRVVSICVIIDGFAGAPSALIEREFQQGRQLICDSLNFLVSTGTMLALAFTGHGAMSFAVGAVAGSTVATVLYYALAPQLVLPGWNTALARRLLRYGLPLAGAALLTLAVFNVDSMIVGSTLGPVLLGLYALAFNISNWPVNVIMSAAGRISFAGFSRVANSRQRLAESFTRALALALVLAVPACVLLGTLAEPLIRTVYGPRWLAAAPVLETLVVLGLLRVVYALAYDCLAAAGQRHLLLWIQAAWLGALIPVLIIGARKYGIVGVGWGQVLVAVGVVGPAFLWGLSRAGVTVRYLCLASALPLIGGALMAAVSLFVIHTVGSGLAGLVTAGVASITVYAPVAFPMRVLLRSTRRPEIVTKVNETSVS